MSHIVTISGWGQPYDALSVIAPTAKHIRFVQHQSLEDIFVSVEPHPDILIGWSLGGQLAMRAIAARLIMPRKLILIATPFQFVKSQELPLGMPRNLFTVFRENYRDNPLRTLTKAWELIARDDTNAHTIRAALDLQNKQAVIDMKWLSWLDTLESFSGTTLNFADFPMTLLIHGDKDLVVYPEQSSYLLNAIPQAKIMSMRGAGHAPQLHNAEAVKQAIYE